MAGTPELFGHQQQFLDEIVLQETYPRACLYFRTGSGKSLAAVMGMKVLGHAEVLVIAPPSTHKAWTALGSELGMTIRAISHAKFRMPGTKVDKYTPVIADEFHMFGGQKGQGWKKLDQLARGLRAPLFLLSATPNYNDAERVYCVQHILDPKACRGGYLQFLYTHCVTEQDPFSQTPKVIGFKQHLDAVGFLSSLPGVWYLEDDLVFSVQDLPYSTAHLPEELQTLAYNARSHRMMASIIERRHTERVQGLVDESGCVRAEIVEDLLDRVAHQGGTALVYCNHATVAEALSLALQGRGAEHRLITGKTTTARKQLLLDEFKEHGGILVGTASIATGTDGMDRVCDTLVILDDTDDDALRRQLVGRIMPRGMVRTSARGKKVLRYVPL